MQWIHLLKGDIRFQFRYGIYAVYIALLLIYGIILYFLPKGWEETFAAIIIYADPSALGMFLMGSLVLLEKSEHTLNSLAVSPISIDGYLLSKLVSIGIVSVAVALAIGIKAGMGNYFWLSVMVFLSSCFYSMIGLFVASKIRSLNQFTIATVPFEILFLIPAILSLFIKMPDFLVFHPGIAGMHLAQNTMNPCFALLILGIWLVIGYYFTRKATERLFTQIL